MAARTDLNIWLLLRCYLHEETRRAGYERVYIKTLRIPSLSEFPAGGPVYQLTKSSLGGDRLECGEPSSAAANVILPIRRLGCVPSAARTTTIDIAGVTSKD